MSHIFNFSNEEEKSLNQNCHIEEEKSSFKRPEFILIDDRFDKSESTYFGNDSTHKSKESFKTEGEQKKSLKGNLSLRFICLLGFIFCVVFGFGMFLWSIALTFLATFSLFRNKRLNEGMRSFWKISVNTVIAGFSFTLGMMSPTLGLGLLALYFSLASDLVEEDLLRKVIRRSFHHL